MTRLAPIVDGFKATVYGATIPIAAWGYFRLARRTRWRGFEWIPRLRPPFASGRGWLAGTVRWSIVAAVAAFALSPSNIMRWHVLALFHLTVLPLVMWVGPLLRSAWSRRTAVVVWIYTGLTAILIGALVLGSPP